jgi:hypothetical protein
MGSPMVKDRREAAPVLGSPQCVVHGKTPDRHGVWGGIETTSLSASRSLTNEKAYP